MVLRSTRGWAFFTLVLAGAITVVFVIHDGGCDLGQATRACNLSAATDLRLFPDAMLYREGADGHDPEGLMTALGALVVGVLLLGWLLHDAPLRGDGPLVPPRWSELVLAHGRNPLLIYFGAHLVLSEMGRWGDPSLLARLLDADWPWGHPVPTLAVLFTGAWAALAWVLHRRRLYLRA